VKHASTAPRVDPEKREIRIVPRSLPAVRESPRRRFGTRVRLLTRDGRLAEVILSAITLVLVTLLLAVLDRALHHPQFSEPLLPPLWTVQPAGG
jgi:hypothetical protein